MNARLGLLAASLLTITTLARADDPIVGIGPTGPIAKVATGFQFTEGPAADAEGRVYFSDVRGNKVLRIGADGQAETVLADSQGCNGLMADAKGRLIACQGGAGRIVAIDPTSGEVEPLAEEFGGRKFERPNDLVVDRKGGVYFTDPGRGAVYYRAHEGEVRQVLAGLARPNGLILSPDERTLYVVPSASAEVLACAVESPGVVAPPKPFCKLEQATEGPARGGDGLAVDAQGNLYLAVPAVSSIQVVSPDGKTLGLFEVAEAPSNCKFGGPDMKTLYITARTSVYAAPMEVTGHRFPAGAK